MLVVACLGAFMAFVDVTIVNVAFPSIRETFGETSLPMLSWILNGYNVAFAALLVPAGRYADMLGHRRSFLVGLLGFTVASIGAGLAPTAATLIAARIVQAIAAAILVPTSLALLLEAFPLNRRATAVALWGAAAAVAAALGPALGGALISASDWRLVFFVNVPLGVIAYWLARSIPGRTTPIAAPPPDPLGIVLLAGSMGSLALGIVQGEQWGWSEGRTMGAFVAAAVLLLGFVIRGRRSKAPAIDLALFGDRTFSLANLGTLIFAAGFYGLLLNNVLFVTQVWGYSALEAGLALTPGPILAAAVAGPGGRLADRFGQRVVIVPGLILIMAGVTYLVASAEAEASYVTAFLPQAILSGAGLGLALPALGSAAVGVLSSARFATGSAINAAARQLGAVVGIAVVVAILSGVTAADRLDAFQHNWLFVIATAAAVLPLATLLRPATPRVSWTAARAAKP